MNKRITIFNRLAWTEQYKEYIFILLLFCLFPFAAVLFSFIRLSFAQRDDKWLYYTFFIYLALWLGAINATKTILSDVENYSFFINAPIRGFYGTVFESWGGTGKEPFFSFVAYISYYFCFGQISMYICLLSTVMYLLHFMAVYKLFTKINAGKGAILCGVLVLAFFTQYFSLTMHLVRQMLAASIVIYAITLKAIDGKNRWVLLLMALLTHTSAGLLVVLSLIPPLSQKMSFVKIIVALSCFVPVIVFNTQISDLMGRTNVDVVDYTLKRLGDNHSEEGNLPLSLMLMVFLPLGIVVIKKLFFDKTRQKELYLVCHLFLFLMLFVLSFYKNPLIQYRFFYYSYSFTPLLLPLLIAGSNKLSRLFYEGVSLFFVVRFFVLYDNIIWKYAPLSDVLFLPFPYLLFHSYF
jgi:hypothetical protein